MNIWPFLPVHSSISSTWKDILTISSVIILSLSFVSLSFLSCHSKFGSFTSNRLSDLTLWFHIFSYPTTTNIIKHLKLTLNAIFTTGSVPYAYVLWHNKVRYTNLDKAWKRLKISFNPNIKNNSIMLMKSGK